MSSIGSYEFAVECDVPAGGALRRVEWSFDHSFLPIPPDIALIASPSETTALNYLKAVLVVYANDPLVLDYGLGSYLEGEFKVEIEYELEGQTVVMSCGGFHIVTI